jgi:hypothetical protein
MWTCGSSTHMQFIWTTRFPDRIDGFRILDWIGLDVHFQFLTVVISFSVRRLDQRKVYAEYFRSITI